MSTALETIAFSFVVPAWNAADALPACLEGLLRQDYPADRYETVVVDDGSTDATAEVARAAGARVIRLPENQGRIRARVEGVRAARGRVVVLVDARVRVRPDCLRAIEGAGQLPLMGACHTEKRRSPVDRLLYLVRRRFFRDGFPPPGPGKRAWLTPTNFDRVPKGFGLFAIEPAAFLAAQPDDQGRRVSDDTRILATIVRDRPVLIEGDAMLDHLERHRLAEVLRHAFQRGPLFEDWYLRPGGRLRIPFVLGTTAAAALLLATALRPELLLLPAAVAILGLGGAVAVLAEEPGDLPVILVLLPLLATVFAAGVLWAKLARAGTAFRRTLAASRVPAPGEGLLP